MDKVLKSNFENKLKEIKKKSLKNYKKIKGNLVHNTAVINWKRLVIGKNNIIGPYVTIGEDANHPYEESKGIIKIGNFNIFREFVQINLPTKKKLLTFIGDRNYLMQFCHVAHDCFLEDDITLAVSTILGGNTHIMVGAQTGFRVTIHQNQVIGSYSMIGMCSIITKNKIIMPGRTYYGETANKSKKNTFGLNRYRINHLKLKNEIKKFKLLID